MTSHPNGVRVVLPIAFATVDSRCRRHPTGGFAQLKRRAARGLQNFENLDQIGEGTYGQVFMAKDKGTGEIVALKKVGVGRVSVPRPLHGVTLAKRPKTDPGASGLGRRDR